MSIHLICSSLLPHLLLQLHQLLLVPNQGKKCFWSAVSMEGTARDLSDAEV